MGVGITFDNIIDAQDYRKMLFEEGLNSELKHISIGKYKVVIVGERKNVGFEKFVNPLSNISGWHGGGANRPPYEHLTEKDAEWIKGKLPPREIRRAMDLQGIPYDIDKEIREVVLDLNAHGIETRGSCAGHVNLPGKKGFIGIKGKPSEIQKTIIKEIAEKHKLNGVEFDDTGDLLFNSLVPVKGETFKTRKEANKYARELESSGHKTVVEKRGLYFMVYRDEEIS